MSAHQAAGHRADLFEQRALLRSIGSVWSQTECCVDPTSAVASRTRSAHGTYVNALVSVGARASLGCLVNLNRSTSIGHHCTLGRFTSTGPGATLCGAVETGFGVFLGAGCVIPPERRIGPGAVVGAGAVVTKDVPEGAIVTGNPARVVGEAPTWDGLKECPLC